MKNQNPCKGLKIYLLLTFTILSVFTFTTSLCQAQNQANAGTYPALILQADQASAARDYATALFLYEKAKHAKPELKYASGKITEINALLDEDQDLRSQIFENIIIKAETLYSQKDYATAKTEYQKALLIDPTAQYPKDRLGQISAVFTDPSDVSYFNDAVANGDKALAASEFDKAVLFYETALAVKPTAKNVKDKIADTRKQQSEYKIKMDQSAKIIAGADKLLLASKRTEARAEYQKALTLTPDNQYAKQKIQEIDKIAGDKKALQDVYDKYIEQADQFYINRDFVNAHLKYQEALKVIPEARYAKEMLEKTKSGQSQLLSEQEKYDAAIAGAESLLKSTDYDGALVGFKSASAIKPNETYPKTRIKEVEKLLSEQSSRKEAYAIAIKNGDQAFNEAKYDAALSHFRNALSLLPAEKYPAQKIEEITSLVAQQKTLDVNYKNSVSEADLLFSQNKFDEAVSAYLKALSYKPDETYPKQKITESQNQLATARNNEEKYTTAIANGDKSLAGLNYNDALEAYKQALAIKPAEKYPRQKSDEVNALLARQKAETDQYTLDLANGDKALEAGNYNLALTSYQDALRLKPNEQYPQQKIAEVKENIASAEKTDAQYTAAISRADQLLSGKQYDEALTAYNEASGLKKNEKYPQEQLAKINVILGQLRSVEESYTQAVSEGDANFGNKKYPEAIESYKRATSFKPSETYPKAQAEKINGLITDQKKLEADYQTAIASADKFFAATKYDEAIADFRKALVLKPAENYPSDKIAEAEKLLADAKALQASYDKAVVDGDKYLSDKDFVSSLASYKGANALKPSETYPKQKIAEVQAILDKDKAEGQRYQEAIAQADKFFTDQKYREALDPYQRASGIKSTEKYPQEQVAKINQILADQKLLDDKYQKAITDADAELKAGKYNESRSLYANAGTLKPLEKLPKEKMAEIDVILADLQNKEENYSKYISVADASFADKKYDEAIISYNNALKIKPSETYPKTQVEKINGLIAEQKKLEADYQTAVASADKLFAAMKYDEAIVDFRKALVLKPAEKYPSDKIAEAEKLLADAKALQASYEKAVVDGDKYLSDKDFVNSLASFKGAGALKPAEAYPKQKIAEVQAILDKDKAEGQRYQEAIAQADKFFTDQKYREALEPYQRASGIKSAEKYPQEQVAKINQILADQKLLDDKYQKAIADADAEMKAGKYNESRIFYANAGTLKPLEKLPKEKMAEIDVILADLQNKEENYSKYISVADASFADKKYEEAIISYNNALKIKPSETYPKTQVEKINGLMAEQKKLEADYQTAIASADKLFAATNYSEAVVGYRNALALKPAEKYPSDKIAESEKLLADAKALQASYEKAVADGDKYLSDKDFVNSLASFKSAGSLKPAEAYPKQKIAEVQAILDKNKAEGQRYQEAISQADKFFTDQKYREALEPYQQASGIKSAEKYPQEQVAKINQILADLKLLDDKYQKAITDADAEMKAGKYNESRILYSNAGTLKPLEKLPKEKMAGIDAILADLQNKEENYLNYISVGDVSFGDKKYDEAIISYNNALKIKPSESYPKTQVEKINGLVAEQKKLDTDFLAVITSADKFFADRKYPESISEYRKALALKSLEKYPAEKIAEAEKIIADQKAQQVAYEKAISDGDKKFAEKNYENALTFYKTALSAKPGEAYPTQKITEIQTVIDKQKTEAASYASAIELADKFFTDKKYREALEPYQRASTIKPSEKYPLEQITIINKLLADQKKLDEDFQKLLADADLQLKAGKYAEARGFYVTAGTLKPAEKLPKDKIIEIDGILADLKQKDENYTKAINAAGEAYSAKNLAGAIKLYEDAGLLKPAEKYPQERITSIRAEIKTIDDNYSKAISLGDSKMALKNLMGALNAYQNALEIKPAEEYPKSKIAEINLALSAQKEEMEKMYSAYVADGDVLFSAKDYAGAKSAFTKATGIKPGEAYPKQRLAEINKTVQEITLARKAEYTKAIGIADNLYKTKIFDQAIEAYEAAAKIDPDDSYPEVQIGKIRKYMTDHSIQELFSQSVLILEGNEKKFTFAAIEPRLRKNNYILLKARSTGKIAPKVYLNYGKDGQKNGGIVLRSLDKNTIADYLIRISVQDKWYREDNNWISLFVETGEVEITKVQIASGDE